MFIIPTVKELIESDMSMCSSHWESEIARSFSLSFAKILMMMNETIRENSRS